MDLRDRVTGCLLAGAVGDGLGAPVEFLSWPQIAEQHGRRGVTGLVAPGRFTDDTQMSLFTVEGLIRARVRGRSKGICHPPSVVRHAYLRWLHTQGVPWARAGGVFADGLPRPDGWLVTQAVLHRRMAPGNTCLSALEAGGAGTVSDPVNNSKGCGAVMRAAPAGFFSDTPADAWRLGCDLAAITHGHRDGIEPAGALAAAIRLITNGEPPGEALRGAASFTPPGPTRDALTSAIDLATGGLPDPDTLNGRLGQGWVGEQALAIGACCALAAPDPAAALLAAVNHSGDSDSTGSIAGNLAGAAHGPDMIPASWVAALEGADLVRQVADDAATELLDPPSDSHGAAVPEWWERYPGW